VADTDWLEDLTPEALDARTWRNATLVAPRPMPPGCARHGSYPAGEWCPGCEAAEEKRLNAQWDREHAWAGDRS
jgi:hypothetical protein